MRLKYLIGLNDPARILENLGAILAWASAEVNIGMFVANLPACRPILEQLFIRFSSWTGSASRSHGGGKPRGRTTGKSQPGGDGTSEQYVLEERPGSSTLQNYLRNGHKTSNVGVETRIYGDLDGESSISLDHVDDGSQNHIVQRVSEEDRFQVNVHKDFRVEVSRGRSNLGHQSEFQERDRRVQQ